MKKKKILIIVIVVVVSLFAILAIGMYAITRDLSYMRDVELRGIDLSTIDDGSYTGSFEHGRFTNTLTVRIENGEIVRVDIDSDVTGAGVLNAADEVFSKVIDAQDTKIDAVTEATATTNAYLLAIENALNAD